MVLRTACCLLVTCILATKGGTAAGAAKTDRLGSWPGLVDTIASRNGLSLSGSWDILAPEKVEATPDKTDIAVTLYALRGDSDNRALLMVQRNVLPSSSGWGPPTACVGSASSLRLTIYESPRDILCGWAEPASFAPVGAEAHVTTLAAEALGAGDPLQSTYKKQWLAISWRISNRNDFLDLQILMLNEPGAPPATTQAFVADVAHSISATWLSESPSAVPMPPPTRKAPEQANSWWPTTLSSSAMKTVTYRVGISIKTFAVASLMAGNAVTGGAIIGVLNFTSTSLYLLNDYLWETWYPLTPASQDFIQLANHP